MKDLGYGRDYKYAHSYEEHFVDEEYLPEDLPEKQFYHPGANAREHELSARLKQLWKDKKDYGKD
jgi:putative ATPase